MIELQPSSQVSRGRKFHIDGGAFIMFAFQIVNEDQEYCFSAATGAVITTWVTTLTKTIALLNPTLMYRTDIDPKLRKPIEKLSEHVTRRAKAKLSKTRSGTYLKQSDQQQRLDYLTAAPILPPKESQNRPRSRSAGRASEAPEIYSKYSESHFSGIAGSVCSLQ